MDNGTYKRNGESDYHCTTEELAQLIRDSSESSQDSTIIDEMELDALDSQSIQSFRERMSKRNPAHPWNDKDDETFLKLISAISKSKSGEYHPTLAGLLMFGYDYSIMSILPNYHLDYFEFGDNGDNWTYRISTGTGEFTGNVYHFITGVSIRISLMNQRGKEIEGVERTDDTLLMRAQRELLVNAVVHADYRGNGGVRAEWHAGFFSVRNPGALRIPLAKMFEGGFSDPRNPHLSLMTGLIGFAERAGSGVCDTVNCCDRLGIPRPDYKETNNPTTVSVILKWKTPSDKDSIEDSLLSMIRANPRISIDAMADSLNMGRSKTSRIVTELKNKGKIQRIGGTRGRWEIL